MSPLCLFAADSVQMCDCRLCDNYKTKQEQHQARWGAVLISEITVNTLNSRGRHKLLLYSGNIFSFRLVFALLSQQKSGYSFSGLPGRCTSLNTFCTVSLNSYWKFPRIKVPHVLKLNVRDGEYRQKTDLGRHFGS